MYQAVTAVPHQTAFDTDDLSKIPIEQVTFHMNVAWFPSNCPEGWIGVTSYNREIYDEFGLMPNTQFRVLGAGDGRVLAYNEMRRKWVPVSNGGEKDNPNLNQYVCVDGLQNVDEGQFYSGQPEDEILIHCIEWKRPNAVS